MLRKGESYRIFSRAMEGISSIRPSVLDVANTLHTMQQNLVELLQFVKTLHTMQQILVELLQTARNPRKEVTQHLLKAMERNISNMPSVLDKARPCT